VSQTCKTLHIADVCMNRGIVQTRLITTTFISNLQNTRHVGQFKVSLVVRLGCATRKLWGMVNVDTRGKLFPATIGRRWKQETAGFWHRKPTQ